MRLETERATVLGCWKQRVKLKKELRKLQDEQLVLYKRSRDAQPALVFSGRELRWSGSVLEADRPLADHLHMSIESINRRIEDLEENIMDILDEGYFRLPDGRILVREYYGDDRIFVIKEEVAPRKPGRLMLSILLLIAVIDIGLALAMYLMRT